MTGPTVGSVVLVPNGWLGAVLGGAWFGGNASAIEQKVTTGKIDLDELALSAGVGGLSGGIGKGIIELGGKGINYLKGGSKVVEDATPSWLLNIGGRGDGDFGHLNQIPKYDLSLNQINLIKNAENISTAKLGTQFTQPRDLSEKVLWNSVVNSPSSGKVLSGLNNDPRFPKNGGFS